jgi:hypothetical protein
VGNLGKIISPLGLALIVGGTDFVKPAAGVSAILPAMFFLAFWAALAALAFLVLGIETKRRPSKISTRHSHKRRRLKWRHDLFRHQSSRHPFNGLPSICAAPICNVVVLSPCREPGLGARP